MPFEVSAAHSVRCPGVDAHATVAGALACCGVTSCVVIGSDGNTGRRASGAHRACREVSSRVPNTGAIGSDAGKPLFERRGFSPTPPTWRRVLLSALPEESRIREPRPDPTDSFRRGNPRDTPPDRPAPPRPSGTCSALSVFPERTTSMHKRLFVFIAGLLAAAVPIAAQAQEKRGLFIIGAGYSAPNFRGKGSPGRRLQLQHRRYGSTFNPKFGRRGALQLQRSRRQADQHSPAPHRSIQAAPRPTSSEA